MNMNLIKQSALGVLVSILAISTVARAQDVEPPGKPITKTYDVRSLCMEVPDYPLQGSMLPAEDRAAARDRDRGQNPEDAPALSPEAIAKLIETTISPETWKEAGGTGGSISEFQGMLIVSNSDAVQQKIADLLAQLRADLRQSVRVQATWVLLAPKDLDALPHVAGHDSLVQLPDDQLKAAKIYCRGQTVGFSGQVVHLATNSKRSYVSDMTPVVADHAVGYQPGFGIANSGVALQVKPQLSADQATVTLDLYSIVTEAPEGPRIDFAHAATKPAGGDVDPGELQMMNILQQQFRTTVNIPLNTNVLIGGMTMEPDAKAEPARQLYLVVRAEADKK